MIRNAKETLQRRRVTVLELSSEGRSQSQIAKVLQVSLATINSDLQHLRQTIKRYVDERLPLEYQKYMLGVEVILCKTWDIANNLEYTERDKLQARSVGMQAYSMMIELLTNATVVERAVRFVDRTGI